MTPRIPTTLRPPLPGSAKSRHQPRKVLLTSLAPIPAPNERAARRHHPAAPAPQPWQGDGPKRRTGPAAAPRKVMAPSWRDPSVRGTRICPRSPISSASLPHPGPKGLILVPRSGVSHVCPGVSVILVADMPTLTGEFSVDDLQDSVWDDAPYDNLVLPKGERDLVFAFANRPQLGKQGFDDFVGHKGKTAWIMVHSNHC